MFYKTGCARIVLAIAILAGSAAQAQQILTAVRSGEITNPAMAEIKQGGTAGETLSTAYGGADTRALTDYGVNKIAASGNASYEQYATSAWLDRYVVGGTPGSTVTVSFKFSVDGLANFNGTDAGFNFNVYALRGDGWSLNGYGGGGANWYSPIAAGNNYDRLVLTQTAANRVTQADIRDFGGFYNYTNLNGTGLPGAFQSHVTYNEAGDYYSIEAIRLIGNVQHRGETRYYATGVQDFIDGVPQTPGIISYTQATAAAITRSNLSSNYSLLDMAQLCAIDECGAGNYPGSDLTLSFSLTAGQSFTLAAFLYADELREGSIDFFHTAKVTEVTVSPGATLSSDSGELRQNANGSYGFAAVQAAAVPEPATWALMLTGFGLVGAAARRRKAALSAV